MKDIDSMEGLGVCVKSGVQNEEGLSMDSDITYILDGIREKIENCDILSYILENRVNSTNVDMDIYKRQGYTKEEIKIGIELIDLYITLVDLAIQAKTAVP